MFVVSVISKPPAAPDPRGVCKALVAHNLAASGGRRRLVLDDGLKAPLWRYSDGLEFGRHGLRIGLSLLRRGPGNPPGTWESIAYLNDSLAILNSDFYGLRTIVCQTWPQNSSRTTGLVLQCRLHHKSAPQTNSNIISLQFEILKSPPPMNR